VTVNLIAAQRADSLTGMARAHMSAKNYGLVDVHPMLGCVEDWENYLSCYQSEVSDTAIRQHSRTGRPAGDDKFLEGLKY
jgi:hypothetical protein